MNKIELIGRTTNDLEVKTAGETKYATFQLAVRRNFKNNKGEYDTDFLPCIISGNTAEVLSKYVKKGDQIGIIGSLRSKTVEKDGDKKTHYSIAVDDFFFLEKKEGSGNIAPSDPSKLPFEV